MKRPFDHRRRSIRLKGYDYTRAAGYFVTIVTHERVNLFGDVVGDAVRLNQYGEIVHKEWLQTEILRQRVVLDQFIIMPNHIHGIIILTDDNGTGTLGCRGTLQRAPTKFGIPAVERFGKPTSDSIPTIVRLFKSSTTKRINEMRGSPGAPVWQRSYFEHVIRNEVSLNRIRQYIEENPLRWHLDRENPDAVSYDDSWESLFVTQ